MDRVAFNQPCMHWLVAAPFIRDERPDWIFSHINDENHDFQYISADYEHDRSRQLTSARQWLDYLRHALRTWYSIPPWRRNIGYISAFPQIPVILGIIKRVTLSKRPILATMFNLGQTYDGIKGVLARFGLQSINLFIVHSTAEIENYSNWLQIPSERFKFIPLSIKLRAATDVEQLTDPFVFAMGSAHRDYRLLFEAVGQLGYKTVVVAGEHATTGLAIPPNVTVHRSASLEECHRLSQQARVNVLPVDNSSTASGQVTLLETMMYGKAVVATQCIGTSDYLRNGETALAVPAKDLNALKAAVDRLWNDAGMRVRLGDNARQYVRDKVSFFGVSDVMHKALNGLRDGAR